MAAGRLPAPGTELGSCLGDCPHTDCAQTRTMALARCAYCDKPIGYEISFYVNDNEHLYHALCLEQYVEHVQQSLRNKKGQLTNDPA